MVSQRGSAPVLLIIIAAALGVGLAASVYLNYVQHQHAADVQRQLNGTITDLKYQLSIDEGGASPSPSASPSASTSPSSSPSPAAVLGSQSLVVKELGIKLTPSAPLADLTYNPIASQTAGATVVALQSPAFIAKYPKCGPVSFLWQIVRRPVGQKAPASNVLITTVGGANYYYYFPANTCATTAPGLADVAAAKAALTDTIFKTITAN